MKLLTSSEHRFEPMLYVWIFLLTIFFLFLATNTAAAQSKISLAVRGGINYPCQGQNDLNLHNGYGFEGLIGYRVLPQLSLVTGWGYNTFDVEDTFEGTEIDFVANGYSLGVLYDQPIASSRLSLIVGGGGIYQHLEVESDAGDVLGDSGHGLGWQVEIGVGVAIGGNLRLTPGLKYRSLEQDIAISNKNTRIDLNYLSAGVSLGWNF